MSSDFTALGIRREINESLRDSGITSPTPVQFQAIPLLMAGKDLIAQSQTGTGKTLAFLLPILEKIKINAPYVQALIVTPTRELARQITKETTKLAQPMGINVLSAYGGEAVEQQIRKLKGNPHIVIGTPGRLLDHARRKTLQLSGVSKLVIDEADQMLHMGFLEDMEEIISQTSGKRQTMLFSATMPAKIRALASQYMKQPANISIESSHVTLDEIKQITVELAEADKLDKLCGMIDRYQPYLAIVFCHTRERVISLNTALNQRGYASDELHGELTQAKRTQVMRRFSSAKLQILVATDIAARGLDIEGVTHVFNYDIPHDAESYIHRIGRTGRAGETGTAVTFVTPAEHIYLRLIEQGIRAPIEKQKANGQTVIKKASTTYKRKAGDTVKPDKKNDFTPAGKKPPKKTVSHSGSNLRSRRKPKTAGENVAKKSYGAKRKAARH
ncbi:MAG: DEAD/DEAH box helicase [Veillonellales bacterium]